MSQTLTRADLADALSDALDTSRNDAAAVVETVIDLVSDSLTRGEAVKLSGFGAFELRDKNGRVGRNPKTGREVEITPRRVLVFKASQVLKDRIAEAAPPAED